MLELKGNVFHEAIKNNTKPVLVNFGAAWCGPCKMLEPIYDELSKEMNESFVFVKVNVDENLNLVRQHNIANIPTIIIYENGKIIDIIIGFKEKEELRRLLNKYI